MYASTASAAPVTVTYIVPCSTTINALVRENARIVSNLKLIFVEIVYSFKEYKQISEAIKYIFSFICIKKVRV